MGAFDDLPEVAPPDLWDPAKRFVRELPSEALTTPAPAVSPPLAREEAAAAPVAVPSVASPYQVPGRSSGPLGRALGAIPRTAAIFRTVSDEVRAQAADSDAADPAEPPAGSRMDRIVSPQDSLSRGGFSSPLLEKMFRRWYKTYSIGTGLHSDPDSPTHNYDWRGAFLAGARPERDAAGEWVWPGDFIITGAKVGDRMPTPNWNGGMPAAEKPVWQKPKVPYPLAKPKNRSGLPYPI